MFGAIVGLVLTGIWYALVLYVFPYERFEQIFLQRGPINIVITFVGFYGLALVFQQFWKNLSIKQDIKSFISSFQGSAPSISRVRETRDIFHNRIRRGYKHVSFFSGLCVSLGFLGTVIGIAGGIGSLSLVFADAGDFAMVKDNIFSLIANLGVAFDSTLLGLIFSIIISVAVSYSMRFNLKVVSDGIDEPLKQAIREGIAADSIVSDPAPLRAMLEKGEIEHESLAKYIKIMSVLGEKLSGLMELQKKMANQIPEWDFTALREATENSNDLLKKILHTLSKEQKPKSYRIIEE